jgi:hypothetical protein
MKEGGSLCLFIQKLLSDNQLVREVIAELGFNQIHTRLQIIHFYKIIF